MVLVLGRPGSGCTTFLKNIANQRGGYLSVDGNISYGGIPADHMGAQYRGEVVYNQEDDVHQVRMTAIRRCGGRAPADARFLSLIFRRPSPLARPSSLRSAPRCVRRSQQPSQLANGSDQQTPGKRLPEQTRAVFQEQVMNLLLKMLGISHTKNTMVGSAFVRGVSGGERKVCPSPQLSDLPRR